MTQVAYSETNGQAKITPLRSPPPFPTTAALALESAPWDEIENTFMRGATPDMDALVGWERFRASQFGIRHYCAIGINSKEANNEGLAREVLAPVALGDPTRVRILDALSHGELCVCDLAAVLSLSQSAVSHQLRLLRGLRLVRARREGRMIFYALDDLHVVDLLRQGLKHAGEAVARPTRKRASARARSAR